MAILQPTGYLDFTWSAVSDAQGYYVKVYKNNSFASTEDVSTNNIRVSGLIEGDQVYSYVYSYVEDNISSSFEITQTQTVPVSTFDLGFSFTGFKVDGVLLNLNETFSGNSHYFNGKSFIDFNIINPRNTGILNDFTSEPLLQNIYHKSKDSNGLVFTSGTLNNNYFQSINSGSSRNYSEEISVEDVHGSVVTSTISLTNEPIYISSIDFQYDNTGDSNFDLNFNVEYSANVSNLEYLFYDNNDFTGDYIASGQTGSYQNFSINLPEDFSGAFKFVPYDWFGSGVSYVYEDLFFVKAPETIYTNTIDYAILDDESYGDTSIIADYSELHDSGSYFNISIDPTSNNSFDQDSFFTGSNIDLSSGLSFNYYTHFNHTGEQSQNFYFHLNLLKSGTNELEDSITVTGIFDLPVFDGSGIDFDYVSGETSFNFSTSVDLLYSGIDILLSGKNYSDYEIVNSNTLTTGDISVSYHLNMVHADDHNVIIDSMFISGSGQHPSITVNKGGFVSADALFPLYVYNDNNIPVNHLNVYRLPSFHNNTDIAFPESYQDILLFENYSEFKVDEISMGASFLSAPSGITRNVEYSVDDIDGLSYSSGLYYMYRFEPVNGYGTGDISKVLNIEFPLNEFTQYLDGDVTTTSSNVSELSDTVNSLTFTHLSDTPTGYQDGGLLISHSGSIEYLDISDFSDSLKYGGVLSNSTAQGIILNTGQTINYDMVSGNKIAINNNNGSDHINLNATNLSRSLIQVFDFDVYSYNLDSVEYTGININLTADNQSVNIVNSGNFLRNNYNVVNIKLMNLDSSWQAIKTYY